MLCLIIVETIVGTIVGVYREVVASACWTDVFPWMIAWFKFLNVVQDGECHGGEWECFRCSKEIKKQQTYKLKPCETGKAINNNNA